MDIISNSKKASESVDQRVIELLEKAERQAYHTTGVIYLERTQYRQALNLLHNKPKIDILPILQEADKALLEGKPVVTHCCIQTALKELTNY